MDSIKRAAALGSFDGLHIGHTALMWRLKGVCAEKGLSPAVVTFDILPQNLVGKERAMLINSREDKAGLIRRMFGIDDIIFLHFDEAMASMPWDGFIDHLAAEYNVRHFVVGRNFRFGKKAEGNCFLLNYKCEDDGMGCDIIPDVSFDGVVSSSTYIRSLLLEGDIERANMFLGHPHILTDNVHGGKRLGSKIGTPTLNMQFAPGVLVPKHGVYATKVYADGVDGLTGVTNIGIRPTIEDSEAVTVETHIPSFEQNLYGCTVRLEFHKYLRPEMKFSGTEELKEQILKDCIKAIEYFNQALDKASMLC